MAKQRKGLLAFIVGAAAGAAAAFLSDKDNREKTVRAAKQAVRKGKAVQKQTTAKVKQAVRKGKQTARRAVSNARKTAKRVGRK
ncbi:MAG: hypothetical protein A2383_03985 [Candidatus Pacebacteria bacterium RIFOXYB1_FULL_39_46]|nr:MAG: hypothetical protein A2182_04240 [Candidatus Pacebacteria bacterium RIFOXYA1_FULL_38_18]OGJ38569.1 MAG: hypothetical protein A2383_03985 [Candidatus Pacebacteria bacterium RIFOXYB1_FULL_39_46]OGJ40429.1 MAG: hypothetical protein A2411_04125 [Candidatus Pacebacteria bacterium RIFOXYC1_FULL_39_21]OGJ40548.1 MAG: hypothetical protein A2582_02870 [Candidatus Pacebacteria bacterium RIFOXYD1_FULL_39_27]